MGGGRGPAVAEELLLRGKGNTPPGKAEVVQNIAEVRLQEYSMDGIKFVQISAKSGLIAYTVSEKGNSHGRDFSARVYISALWAERGGKWVALFSQETAPK